MAVKRIGLASTKPHWLERVEREVINHIMRFDNICARSLLCYSAATSSEVVYCTWAPNFKSDFPIIIS